MTSRVALLACTGLLLASGAASAAKKAAPPKARVAVASIVVDGVKHTAKVKLDARGKILPWSASKWAEVSPGKGKSFFSWLGEARGDDGALEYERTTIAKNGYSLVTLGTTADAVTFGVSLKDGKGFFKYSDHGSGNGNSTHTLVVKEAK